MSAKEALRAFAAASEDDLPRLLLVAARAVSGQLTALLNRAGHPRVRPAHAAVFANLDAEGTHASVLAERADMTRQGMSKLIAELSDAGYVAVVADEKDRRAALVMLTPEGEELCHVVAAELLADLEGDWRARLGDSELRALRVALRKLSAPPAA